MFLPLRFVALELQVLICDEQVLGVWRACRKMKLKYSFDGCFSPVKCYWLLKTILCYCVLKVMSPTHHTHNVFYDVMSHPFFNVCPLTPVCLLKQLQVTSLAYQPYFIILLCYIILFFMYLC